MTQTKSIADDRALAGRYARCFRGGDGEAVLTHLRALTRDRVMGPEASEAQLRHLEGQRHLVRLIEGLVDFGRTYPDLPLNPTTE